MNKKRGMRCIVPETIKNDLRLETKLSSACRDVHKTECRTLADYKDKGMDFAALVDCTRFFPAKTCVTVDKISVNSNAKPVCTTKITNFCASEDNVKVTRFADRASDADFDPDAPGQYAGWNTFTKEFYEFIRPHWVAADGEDNTDACQSSPDLEIAADQGTDFLTIDVSHVSGGGDISSICGGDRADVAALKAIINDMANNAANADIMGVPATLPIDQTGKERATAMMDRFTDAIAAWAGGDANGEETEITALLGDGNGGTGPDNLKVTALGSPSFELFSLVIGALDDLVDPASGTTADFPQASADPAVSYRDTSLMNMPKSEFDVMINAVHPGVTTTVTAKSVKDQYQALINMAGDASPVEQVFWNFLADTESPVELSDNQLDAIAQAMSQADLSHSDDGSIFCGALTSLNQILRSGILSDSEADAIMREIQDHDVAVHNVAVMLELMNYLEDGAALTAALADYSAHPPKTVPTPQEALDAAYANWVNTEHGATGAGGKDEFYNFPVVDNSDPSSPVIAAGFDPTVAESVYYKIIAVAVDSGAEPATCGGVAAGCDADASFKTAVMTALTTANADGIVPLTNAASSAESCVDNSLGAPQIYKDVFYHYLTAGATPLADPLVAEFPADLAGWKSLHDPDVSPNCVDDAAMEAASLTPGAVFACRLAHCIESMHHVTFANPAGEACDDITGCLMLTGDTDAVTKFASWCETGDYKYGLNQVLSAVAVLDADPGNDLETINGLFKEGTDFAGINYQSQAPLEDTINCPGDSTVRTLDVAMREMEQRQRGIITGGFVVDGIQNFKGSSAAQKFETQTVNWWDTTLAWTTEFFNKPVQKPNKNGGHRGLADDEPPSITSFDEVMAIALNGHQNTDLTWTPGEEAEVAAFCTINPCMACVTHVDGKVISTSLQDGRTSSECVCPAIVSDVNEDQTPDTPADLETHLQENPPAELAQPIYAQVVLDYFANWELKPAVSADDNNGIAIPAEKFRPDELQCVAAALADLPAPTGQSMGMPMTRTQYMTHTRGIVIQHLMSKIYAKNDLDLETRIQGALDETQFRHNMYFILETLFQVEQEIREDAAANSIDPIDFSILNKLHVESSGVTIPDGGAVSNTATLDWRHPEMAGNTADILTQAYMEQILNGLGGGTADAPITGGTEETIKNLVLEHYEEIFTRTSELADCLNREKERVVSWICDERVPEAEWQVCAAGQDNDDCWLALMAGADRTPDCTTIDQAMADNEDLSDSSACACDRFDVTRCRADATLQTNNDNWTWGAQNTLFGAYNQQWMMDMASYYSSGEGSAAYTAGGGVAMTQAEICALDQAFAAAMGAGAAGAANGANDFRNAYNQVANYIRNSGHYSTEFADKVQGIINAAQGDKRQDELNWLMDTATDLSGGYQWNWNGQAANGEGHGSAQMNELLNLMDGMQNGGDWDVLGTASGGTSGDDFDHTQGLTEQNDGTGGVWTGFDGDAYNAWITDSLNQNTMGADWAAANTGDQSRYQENYDQWWGWRSTAAPGPPGPTNPPTTIGVAWVGVGKEVSADDLPHATCLMDEQLKLIEEFFVAQGVASSDATLIKDQAKLVLESGAVASADNPDNINWFQGSLDDINGGLEQALADLAVEQPLALEISSQPGFATLVTQLQLMADIGDPENKDSVDKDQFKAIDWNSIIPDGTTVETYDPTTVFQNAEAQIASVGGTTPAGLADEINRTDNELTNIAPNQFATGTTAAPVTDAPVTDAPVTDAPVTDAPITDAPVTDAPVTDAPVTDAPVTDAPVTDAPVTDAPVTDAPVTDAPVTDAPVTDAPVTDAPVTDAPSGAGGGGAEAATNAPDVTAAPGDTAATAAATTTTAADPSGNGGNNANGLNNDPDATTAAPTGSGGNNANGLNNDPNANNGYGSMYGDPHIFIKNPDEPAVCFDIHGMYKLYSITIKTKWFFIVFVFRYALGDLKRSF